ncbi:MAG: MATE family efflux transporter [Vicingaceae bacterium]
MNSIDLTTGSIFRHLMKMTLPMMVGIISLVAFNLIDTYYVGQLGERELAALSFTFPVITVIFSLVQGLGIGATAIISRSIGKGDMSAAASETTNSLFLGVFFAGVFVMFGLGSIDFTFRTLGAEEDLIPMIREYMEIWYIAVLFVVVPFIGNSAMRATGDAKTPSMIMLFAVIINGILDPIFIFGLGPIPSMGIKGAAIATAISRFLTLVLAIYVLYRRKRLISLNLGSFREIWKCWTKILYVGIPTGLSRMITPISASVITAMLASYGEFAVAAYGIGTRVEFLTASLLIALSTAVSPFTGQNWGAQRIDRIQKALHISGVFSLVWGSFSAIFLFIFAGDIARIFTDDGAVIYATTMFLKIVPFSFGFQGIAMIVNANLNTMNRPFTASILIILQMVVIYLPLAYFGSYIDGLRGIFIALFITYFAGGSLSFITSLVSLRRIRAKQR